MTIDKSAGGLRWVSVAVRDLEPEPTVAWDYMPTRRQAACGAALLGLLKVSRRLYFWTVTFEKPIQDEVAAATMTHLWQRWQRKLGKCSCVRVCEIHPGGHGLHFHIVVNRRYPAGEVWRLSRECGCGRVDVQTIQTYHQAIYVAKYLGKDSAKVYGVNRYSRGGHDFGTVRGMVQDSQAARLWKRAWSQAKGASDPRCSALSFVRIMERA